MVSVYSVAEIEASRDQDLDPSLMQREARGRHFTRCITNDNTTHSAKGTRDVDALWAQLAICPTHRPSSATSAHTTPPSHSGWAHNAHRLDLHPLSYTSGIQIKRRWAAGAPHTHSTTHSSRSTRLTHDSRPSCRPPPHHTRPRELRAEATRC